MTKKSWKLECKWCDYTSRSEFYDESILIHHLKDYYMYRKTGKELLEHVCIAHPEKWPKRNWARFACDGVKGYTKAFLKDLGLFPLYVVGFVWHLVTAIFVCIDNTMWGDWL